MTSGGEEAGVKRHTGPVLRSQRNPSLTFDLCPRALHHAELQGPLVRPADLWSHRSCWGENAGAAAAGSWDRVLGNVPSSVHTGIPPVCDAEDVLSRPLSRPWGGGGEVRLEVSFLPVAALPR